MDWSPMRASPPRDGTSPESDNAQPEDSRRSVSPRSEWKERIITQLKERQMECPLIWTTSPRIYSGMSLEKLEDLVTLAPSVWDRIIRQLVQATSLLFKDKGKNTVEVYAQIKALLGRCHSSVKLALSADGSGESSCPILLEYREALLHVLYATFVSTFCIYEEKEVSDSPVAVKVDKHSSLSPQMRAAVSAIRGQFMYTCYLARTRFISKQNIPYADAMLAMNAAKEGNPHEGQWKSLYGSLLPDDIPRKLTLLQRGYLLRRSPLTTLALADYMLRLHKFDLAFELCTQAVLFWPASPFAAQAYVSMYLSCPVDSPGRAKLSRTFAERCLFRLLHAAPRCLFAVGLTHELLGERARLDSALVCRALVLYDPTIRAPWLLPQPSDAVRPPPQLDSCNCVCSSRCCHLTYRSHGTLLTDDDIPISCFEE